MTVRVLPSGSMQVLSQMETSRVLDVKDKALHRLFRKCALAVLSSGNHSDDGKELLERYSNFDIKIQQTDRGIQLEIDNPPEIALVDGQVIQGLREHLYSVLRDLLYTSTELHDLDTGEGITDRVFQILRNARMLEVGIDPNLCVCWGGHSISREEYDYTKNVGYHLGLRGIDICTGCGPGAMKGPMKGAALSQAKQRNNHGRFVGLTEPGIMAAEAPNAIVNRLVILPDIEKRLEAFVRFGHAIVVFPGGAGTTEEILYLLGILLHPKNSKIPYPIIFTAPKCSADYFDGVTQFIGATLGREALNRVKIIIEDPEAVAISVSRGIADVRTHRKRNGDAYYFNWGLHIVRDFQQPFVVTHETMANLDLSPELPVHDLAVNLRRAFSGIVTGNVKENGIRMIEKKGHFVINGSPEILKQLDKLLQSFVKQQRMRLPGKIYKPCFKLQS